MTTEIISKENIDELIGHQKMIDSMAIDVKNLEKLISDKRQEIQQALQGVPSISHISRGREDILALVAIGKAGKADIDAFDKDATGIRNEHSIALKAASLIEEDNLQAIAGLERKLTEAKSKLDAISGKSKALLKTILLRQAESIATQYVAAAEDMRSHYLSILALNGLLISNNLAANGIVGLAQPLTVPSFNLAACRAIEHHNYHGVIYNDTLAYISGDVESINTQILDEIRKAGVKFL